MKPTIKLSDIVENIEMASDGRYAFYEVVPIVKTKKSRS